MHRYIIAAAAGAGLATGIILGLGYLAQPQPAIAAGAPARWEYKIENTTGWTPQDRWNDHGAAGWKLIELSNGTAVFERRKQ